MARVCLALLVAVAVLYAAPGRSDSQGAALVVVNLYSANVLRVDLETGQVTTLADLHQTCPGDHPPFDIRLSGIVLEPEGTTALVVDWHNGAVLRVRLEDGACEIVSDSSRGSGDLFEDAAKIAIAPDGTALVVDTARSVVVRVDRATGDRSPFPDSGVGPPLVLPVAIAVRASGELLVSSGGYFLEDYDGPYFVRGLDLISIDPATGDHALVLTATDQIHDVEVEEDGSLLLVTGVSDLISAGTLFVASRLTPDYQYDEVLAYEYGPLYLTITSAGDGSAFIGGSGIRRTVPGDPENPLKIASTGAEDSVLIPEPSSAVGGLSAAATLALLARRRSTARCDSTTAGQDFVASA